MTDKKEFKKTKHIAIEILKPLIKTEFYANFENVSANLIINELPVDQHLIMKILEPVLEQTADDGTVRHFLRCKYKHKDFNEVFLQVRVSPNAVKRLLLKNPEDTYVGKYAFFTKSMYEGKNVQFINTMRNYREPQTIDDLFSPKIKEAKKKFEEATGETTDKITKDVLACGEMTLPEEDLINRLINLAVEPSENDIKVTLKTRLKDITDTKLEAMYGAVRDGWSKKKR